MDTVSFPGVKSGRGVTLTPHSRLVPWSRKSRAIPLLALWAVRPVQSLSACTRVLFTFFYEGCCPKNNNIFLSRVILFAYKQKRALGSIFFPFASFLNSEPGVWFREIFQSGKGFHRGKKFEGH